MQNEAAASEVHGVKMKKKEKKMAQPKKAEMTYTKSDSRLFNCGKCGKLHAKGRCPAYGKTCYRCRKQHHCLNAASQNGCMVCKNTEVKRKKHHLQEQ